LKVLDELAIPINIEDTETLKKIVITAMSGKSGKEAAPKIADLLIEAVRTVGRS